MRLLALGFALLVLVGCGDKGPKLDAPIVTTLPNGAVEVKNSGPSGWVDTTGWKLVELYRVGGVDAEGLGAEELVDPQSVALGAAGGVYVADQKPAVIKQFGPDGGYIRSFGREGSGPGEFQVAFIASALAYLRCMTLGPAGPASSIPPAISSRAGLRAVATGRAFWLAGTR